MELVFILKDFLKNLFNWRGRLSREGYWLIRLFVFIADIILWSLFSMLSDTTFLGTWIFRIILIWKLVLFFPLLFAAMRRYHDSGKPGWLALLLGGLGRLSFAGGAVWFVLVILILALGGPSISNNGNRLLGGGLLVFAVGCVLCFVNFIFLIRASAPSENACGKPKKSEDA